MTNKEFEFLLQQGEGYNLEFKESYNSNLAREICAMANANGGKVLIGITDDGKVKPVTLNNKIKSEIQDLVRKFDPSFEIDINKFNGVVIIEVPEGKKKPYSTGGKFYMRQGANSQQLSRDEIRDFFFNEGILRFDEMPNERFNYEKDFNRAAYNNFLEEAGIKTKLSQKAVLRNLELMNDSKLRNAAVLLFCKKASRFLRSATITCALFMGKTKTKVIDSKEFDADLLTNYQKAFNYIQNKLNTEYIIKGGPREEVLELPEQALREALLNAIAHRDYFSNANIQVGIYSDRVEIFNPGGLVGNIKVEDLYTRSFPRNHLLFGLMQRMELVEKIGSGLMRMGEMMEEYLLPHPNITVGEAWFEVRFDRPNLQEMSVEQRKEKYHAGLGDRLGDRLGDNQRKIIEIIKENSKISIPQLAERIGISTTAVENNLSKLKKLGIIRRVGTTKKGFWEIPKMPKSDNVYQKLSLPRE